MKTIIVSYIPVLHQGYLQFFAKQEKARELYLIGEDFTQLLRPLQKDIRAVSTEVMKKALKSLDRFEKVEIVRRENIENLQDNETTIIMPDEDISRDIADKYFVTQKVEFDSIFLRWDHVKIKDKVDLEPDVKISSDQFEIEVINHLKSISQKSSDFWRQVGAAIFYENELLVEKFNHHLPYHMQQYTVGDPRGYLHRGEGIEFTTSIHAEASAIAQAARTGIKLEGCTMFVTTFPCPICAKLIGESGIKKLYYSGGYALLDGEEVLKSFGVEIVKVVDARG